MVECPSCNKKFNSELCTCPYCGEVSPKYYDPSLKFENNKEKYEEAIKTCNKLINDCIEKELYGEALKYYENRIKLNFLRENGTQVLYYSYNNKFEPGLNRIEIIYTGHNQIYVKNNDEKLIFNGNLLCAWKLGYILSLGKNRIFFEYNRDNTAVEERKELCDYLKIILEGTSFGITQQDLRMAFKYDLDRKKICEDDDSLIDEEIIDSILEDTINDVIYGFNQRDEECFLPHGWCGTANPAPIRTFRKAEILKKEGKYLDAIEMYNKAIDSRSGRHRYYGGKAFCLKELGAYEKAIENYDLSLLLNPNIREYYEGKAQCLKAIEYENLNKLINCLDELEDLDEKEWINHFQSIANNKYFEDNYEGLWPFIRELDNVKFNKLNLEKTIACLIYLGDYNSEDTLVHIIKKGQIQTLREHLKELTNIEILQNYNENRSKQCYQIAIKLERKENYEKALNSISKAIELNPNNIEYKNKLQELQNKQKAQTEYQKSIDLAKKRKYEEAIACIKESIELDPQNLKYQEQEYYLKKQDEKLYKKALKYAQIEQYEDAIDCCRKAIQLQPNNTKYKNTLKEIQRKILEEIRKEDEEEIKQYYQELNYILYK